MRENYERQLDNLDNYVDRFSRIDLSELSDIEQEIIALVQEGRMEEAIAKYEEQNYVDKYTQEVAQLKEVSSAIDQLSEIKTSKEQSRDSILAAIDRQIETLKLAGGKENNQKILNLYKTTVQADSTNINWMLNAVSFLFEYTNDYKLALDYASMALRNALIQYGDDNPLTAKVYSNLGSLYETLGNCDDAFKYNMIALRIFEKAYGSCHPEIATSYNNMASIYSKIFGEDNINVAYTQINLGSTYDILGDYAQALECFEQALSTITNVLGEKHPTVSIVLNNMGAALEGQGNYTKALENYQQALSIICDAYGEKHSDAAVSYNNIGSIYYKQRNYLESAKYLNKTAGTYSH